MAARVSADSFEKEILKFEGLAAAEFYSDSCIPCKRMSPVLAELEEENPDIRFVKININFDSELAGEYEVSSVPSLVFFKNGSEVGRINGAVKKSEIGQTINNLRQGELTMTITVAGIKKEYNEGITVKELIAAENVETPEYVTVSLNDEFIEQGSFESTVIKDGDSVEFLYFMGGGSL